MFRIAADILRACTVMCLIAGCQGRAGAPVPTDSLALNEIVLGEDSPNVLKGMMVAVDSENMIGYATGIMTTNLAVVDLVGGDLLGSFSISDDALDVCMMAVDQQHGKVWIVSKRGNFLKIVDPREKKLLLDLDISQDMLADINNYPVHNIAVDPAREEIYLARSDGGGRVSVYDALGTKLRDMALGQCCWNLRWDTDRDALVTLVTPVSGAGEIFVLPQGDTSQIVSIPVPAAHQGGAVDQIAVGDDGDFYVAGSSLWRLERATGAILWSVDLASAAEKVEVSGNEVAVLHKHGTTSDDDYYSHLVTYRADSGQKIASRRARYECSHMAAIASGGFFVGNAGDASVGIYPSGPGEPRVVDVGTAVEDIHFSSDGQRLFMLNRLGGSQLIEHDLATGESRILEDDEVGAWPMRMVINEAEDKIFILSHFESKLSVISLSDLQPQGSIDLGETHSLSDSVSDLASDPAGELLACLLCEKGKVVIVDGASDSILASVSLGAVQEGYGPGRMNAAVDASGGRIWVYMDDQDTIYRLDRSNGFKVTPGQSAVVIPDHQAESNYSFQGVYYSPSLDKLLVWDQIVNPQTLDVEGEIPLVQRAVAENNGYLYAERYSDGVESLLRFDLQSQELVSWENVGSYSMMGSYLGFDFPRERFAQALSAESKVFFFELADSE